MFEKGGFEKESQQSAECIRLLLLVKTRGARARFHGVLSWFFPGLLITLFIFVCHFEKYMRHTLLKYRRR